MLALCYYNNPYGGLQFSPSLPRGLILRAFALQFFKDSLQARIALCWLVADSE